MSKRRDRPYQAGRSTHWVKVKNEQHPAMRPGDGDVRVMIYGRTAYAENSAVQGDVALIVAGTCLPLWRARPNLF
jgi:ATP-dependent DNA ligase